MNDIGEQQLEKQTFYNIQRTAKGNIHIILGKDYQLYGQLHSAASNADPYPEVGFV
ncbi:MAG: hypothetical protein K0Q85_864 [Caproiciproducens sp.]|jgi:hypothetical protein|nr:hypothetical protein [Caproiciproducens sp.]